LKPFRERPRSLDSKRVISTILSHFGSEVESF